MNRNTEEGARLEFSGGHRSVTNFAAINEALAPFGPRIWPLDLRSPPISIRQLLEQMTLDDAQTTQVREHFLLSRERILDIIAAAGRVPQVPGGGEMCTCDSTHDVTYPQLYIVGAGVDFS